MVEPDYERAGGRGGCYKKGLALVQLSLGRWEYENMILVVVTTLPITGVTSIRPVGETTQAGFHTHLQVLTKSPPCYHHHDIPCYNIPD